MRKSVYKLPLLYGVGEEWQGGGGKNVARVIKKHGPWAGMRNGMSRGMPKFGLKNYRAGLGIGS